MHRIDAADHVAGQFSDGDPSQGVPGTKVDAAWFNAVQNELVNLLEGMGIVLDKGSATQLLGACVAAATAQRIVRRDAAGRAKVADPSAADDIDTRGARDAAISTHAAVTSTHGATSAATASRIVLRDAAGKAQAATPVGGDPVTTIATKEYVDGRFPLAWTRIEPGSGWTNDAGAAEFQWAKDAFGFVHLRGSMAVAAAGASSTVATLPAGARTGAVRRFGNAVSRILSSTGVTLFINALGSVSIPSSPDQGDRYYFDGIYFLAEQ